MMDEQTIKVFEERMVPGPDSVFKDPVALAEKEFLLFKRLRSRHYASTRLEQERLPLNYVMKNITDWII